MVVANLNDESSLTTQMVLRDIGEEKARSAKETPTDNNSAVGYDKWEAEPWQTVEGIEFRSVTLTAVKPSTENLYHGGHAVMYKGPFSQVSDDLGNIYPRGERIAVSKRTFDLISHPAYCEHFIAISPANNIDNGCFCKPAGTIRPVKETKGGIHGSDSNDGNSRCC